MLDRAAVPAFATREASFFALAEDMEARAKTSFMEQIQAFSARKVQPDDVHVRGMRIVNSRRDFYYSRFTLPALDEIARLLPGRPVMVGHRYDGLPVGRFFAAERTLRQESRLPRKDSYWVESLFYTPRDNDGDALVRRIDLGLYREVSLGWRFKDAQCGLCKRQIMDSSCRHVPGEVYENGICDYSMSGITGVREGSLVFAGGQKDTHTFVPGGERSAPSTPVSLGEFFAGSEEIVGIRTCASILSEKRAVAAERNDDERLRAAVQSVLVQKGDRFDTRDVASRWVREHDFRADVVDENDNHFRFTQFEMPSDATSRNIRLDEHVEASVVKRDRVARRDGDHGGLAEFFAS